MKIARGGRLLLLSIFCSALLLPPARVSGQAGQAELEVAIPFFETEALQIADGIAVGLYSSLIEQHFLYVVDLNDGRELARVDDVGQAQFAFDGRRVVYAAEGSATVMGLDVRTGATTLLWQGAADAIVRKVYSSTSSVAIIVESTAGFNVVRLGPTSDSAVAGPFLPKSSTAATFFLSEDSALLWSDDGQAHWCRETAEWQALTVSSSIQITGLVGSRLLGINASSPEQLLGAALPGSGSGQIAWETLFTATSPLLPLSIHTRDQTITLVERNQPQSRIVTLALDPSGEPELTPLPSRVPATDFARQAWSQNRLGWTERRNGRLYLVAVRLVSTARPLLPSYPLTLHDRLDRNDPARRGIEWLERQLGARFSSREQRSARLINSYEGQPRGGWVYDAALAAITFTASGNRATANELLSGLEHLQGDDGSWPFSYDPDLATPRNGDRLVGSIAWVVMAANFYEWDTGDRTFGPMARRALSFLERFRNGDSSSEMYGGFTMGPDKPGIFSTEHNADCFAAFLWRGLLERDSRYQSIADDILAFVVRQIWVNENDAVTNRFFKVGARDASVYLDAQTWTTLSFGGHAPEESLRAAVATAQRLLTVQTGRLGNVDGIAGFDESASTGGAAKVWAEGSEGMVAALISLGDVAEARRYQLETERYQTATGGVPYTTENDLGWNTAPAVAATAWFVLNRQDPPRNPFNPDVAAWKPTRQPQVPLIP